MTSSAPAVEEAPSAEPVEPAQPEPISSPDKRNKKKLWIVIVAIIVVAALVGTAAYMLVFTNKLKVTMDPEEIPNVPAGGTQALSVEVKWGSSVVDSTDGVEYSWSVSPDTLGSLDFERRASVTFEAGNSGGEGTVTCEVTYEGKTAKAEADVTVDPPFLDTVNIIPSSKILLPDEEFDFTAVALDSVGETVTDATMAWSASGADAGDYTLSSTSGQTVTFSCSVEADVVLTAVATSGGETATGTAAVTVTYDVANRTVDTRFYDMFNVPLGPWYADRYFNYGDEWAITDEFPYMYIWAGEPIGNTWIYSLSRMTMTARNLTSEELSMNENPEFLPYLSGPDGARGGTAVLDWYMNYATFEECEDKLGSQALDYYDGWYVELNGTTTLDEEAAKAVLGITDSQFDDFETWWSANGASIKTEWQEWMEYEASGERLCIYPAYEYYLDIVYMTMDGEKVGDEIVLTFDTISWGMEALMFRWMYESWMPTEWYLEDMDLHATIGPEGADVDLETAVGYALYAYEATDVPGAACWAWEALVQDYVQSSPPEWPISLYDPYKDFEYYNVAPGSDWYGTNMTWDYTPMSWNLTAGESLVLEWPDEEIVFFLHDEDGSADPLETDTLDITVDKVSVFEAVPTCTYAEPMPSDAPDFISIDYDESTVTYLGPFDMWNWSRTQTEHDWLTEEWERLEILPYGIPFVEFRADIDVPQPELVIEDMPASVEMGEEVSFNVTVYNEITGLVYPDYTGTVTFTSSDLAAVLPEDYSYESGDMGKHEFTVTFNTVDPVSHQATHYLTVVDEDAEISDTVSDILVVESPRLAAFEVVFESPTVIAYESVNAAVTALNQWDETFTGYVGTVNFTSSDDEATLPPNTTYDPADEGVKTFAVTYVTEGLQTLNATDVDDSDATGEDSVTVLPMRAADSYVLKGLTETEQTNITHTLNITIVDQYGDEFPAYDGVVRVEANCTEVILPPDEPFTPGTPYVEVEVTFTAERYVTIYCNDTSDDIKGTTLVRAVDEPSVLENFTVKDIPNMWENNVSDVTVVAYDQYGTIFEDYVGEIEFFTDASGETLPGLYTFQTSDEGSHTFEDAVSFNEPGTFDVWVEDTSDPTKTGIQEDIVIEDLEAEYLELTSLSTTVTENESFSVTVTVYHQFDEVFVEYVGEVNFTTSDPSEYDSLPANYTFDSGDAGEHDFSGLSLVNVGTQTITVVDTADPSLTDTLEIEVISKSSAIFRIYDMFEEPWGPWWDYRVSSATWDTERILTETVGEVTYLYSTLHNPEGDLDDQGVIYAPYRWNVTAEMVPNLDVHRPMFMKNESSDTPIAGAEASMHIKFQYLYSVDDGPGGWWEDYWVPEWGNTLDWQDGTLWPTAIDADDWFDDGETWLDGHDGYFMATYYNVTMNREAAEEWIGLPQIDDPATWWGDNKATYIADWDDWIDDQADNVYDIYCGYEWSYTFPGTMMRLDTVGDDVVLEIGHFSLGYEALITRWLNAAQISVHQPYFEDFEMVVDYREDDIDVTMDGVCHWSLHAVLQNGTSIGEDAPCAWAWEPIGLDYMHSFAGHPSDYDPYAYREYECWNCGDVNLGNDVVYEYTPWEMDLLSYATIVVELPETDVPGYYGEIIDPASILNVWNGDTSDYDAIRYYGSMEPGYMDLNGSSYEVVGNTIIIEGPCDFDNPRDSGLLYHGAPWLEFNVVPSVKASASVGGVAPSVGIVADEPVTTGGSAVSTSTSVVCELVSLMATLCAVLLAIGAMAASINRRQDVLSA